MNNEYITEWQYISTVYLMLGPACNMTCKHCSQTAIKNTYSFAPVGGGLNEDMTKFLIEWGKDTSRMKNLYFWGGEPLLYLSTIKNIIQMLEENNVVNVTYYIFTNGILLNKEVADYFESKKARLIMSYDAPNATALRNCVPSEEAVKVFNEYKGEKRINSSFTAQNTDLIGCHEFIKEKFPNVTHSIAHFTYLKGNGLAKICIDFKDGEITKAIDAFATTEVGKKWIDNKNKHWVKKYGSFPSFDIEAFMASPRPYCNHGFGVYAFDFNGNCYLCHNVDIVVGNIKDGYTNLMYQSNDKLRELTPPACLTCEILPACRCGCPVAQPTEDGKEFEFCKYMREMYKACKKYDTK